MATTPTNPPKKGFTLTLPSSITIKDLITIITAVVSMSLAWATTVGKITEIEKEVARLTEHVKSLSSADARMLKAIRRLEGRQQDDELLLDQVFILLKRPLPKRRATDPE